MRKNTFSELRAKALQTIKDLRSGKISPVEADEIYKDNIRIWEEYKQEKSSNSLQSIKSLKGNKSITKNLDEINEESIIFLEKYELEISNFLNKDMKYDSIKQQIKIETPKGLSLEHKELANKIKSKMRRTAELIVEIGEEISNAVKGKPTSYKELFYNEIGMSKRSALRYQQIANHIKIQELKLKSELECKTMTDLLLIMAPEQDKKPKKVNVHNVAKGFYNRYKNDKDSLKEIIDELQKLLTNN